MADDSNGFTAFMAFMDGSKSGNEAKEKVKKEDKLAVEDEYSYEEEQEREAMMKSYHPQMKQWFRQNPHLTETYGPYPLFWQDLKTWTPYREVLKKYLRETDGSGKQTDDTPTGSSEATTATTSKEGTETTTGAEQEQPKRRKKSRWGDSVEDTAGGDEGDKKRKKSRWAPAGATPAASANLVNLLTQQQQQAMAVRSKLELINQKLTTVAFDAARIEKDPNRSPSPPPQYDGNGKRTNTREVRMRMALEKERQELMDQMVKINPLFKPPSDYQRQKITRKIYIPVKEFPNYNFIGLIIGPRGNTQKRMEKESNCKIAIRGKGSVKEGSKGKKVNADENDDLHVLVMGDREEDVERAAKEVQSLLVPIDDTRNEHKQKQLRELALINGTLRDDDFCHLCGEKGHRQWECPNREKSFKPVDVRCAICGDSSHPTRDCTQKDRSAAENAAIDQEYQSFMQQLGEKPVISSASATVAAAPWLQSSSTSSATAVTSEQDGGAPGTTDAAAPTPATLGSTPATAFPPPVAAPTMGSTPATAYPPPVAAVAGAYAYPTHAQAQAWSQWGAGYYYGYDQNGQPVAGADYQQYAAYYADPNAAAAATQQQGAEYGYQYPAYQSHPPQQ